VLSVVLDRYPWLAGIGFLALVVYLVFGVILTRRADRRVRLLESGCCVNCGYDLRGTTDRCRCPECGTPYEIYARCRIEAPTTP
jgi:hypothetical protein